MILDRFRLDGRIAVVTGARTGLGQGIAVALAEAGADIVAVGSTTMDETMAAVGATGRDCHFVLSDLNDPEEARQVVPAAMAAAGRIDILVNNAGITRRAETVDLSLEEWSDVLSVNLTAPFVLSQDAARAMMRLGNGGRIINVASVLSLQGGVKVPSYVASKHGVLGLTRVMANELAPHGITVNAIAPGYMHTDMTDALRDDPDRTRQILDRVPVGRWGTPDDLAGAAVFLASEAASFVTGTIIPVDGGWLSR